jgi:hypothetical protein
VGRRVSGVSRQARALASERKCRGSEAGAAAATHACERAPAAPPSRCSTASYYRGSSALMRS